MDTTLYVAALAARYAPPKAKPYWSAFCHGGAALMIAASVLMVLGFLFAPVAQR